MRSREPSALPAALRTSAGCLPPGPGAASTAAPGPGVVRASIEIRAPIDEALRRWSQFSALKQRSAFARRRSRLVWQLDVERAAAARSRVTLQLAQREGGAGADALRRAVEDHLVAFKGFVDDDGGLLRCGNAPW